MQGEQKEPQAPPAPTVVVKNSLLRYATKEDILKDIQFRCVQLVCITMKWDKLTCLPHACQCLIF